MEQNQVSDEELLARINKVLHEAKQDSDNQVAEVRQDDSLGEKFHDVYETAEQANTQNNSSEVNDIGVEKNLVLENHYLSLQLQAEKKKAKELQTKFKLFENSVKYLERLNGQFENIKRAVDEGCIEPTLNSDYEELAAIETMQKIRPKTVHTAAAGIAATGPEASSENFSEPTADDKNCKSKITDEKEEVVFRDAEDFKLLEHGLEIVKDKNDVDGEAEKVFITKVEKRCLEDIGNLASRTRTPLDDKHQRYFEKERRKFAHSITMPEIQEVDKTEAVPPEIISKTKETPVNLTSTELDGLRSYLLQLKELIARRETAWARTTERDYNQRVEITRFKNEVGRLRMLCEKRKRDIKERDEIIASKDEEIKELQKRIQPRLRNGITKKDDRIMDAIDGMANEALENSQIVQRSYNAMKRQSMLNRASSTNNSTKPSSSLGLKPASKSKESIPKKSKNAGKKTKTYEVPANEDEWKSLSEKVKYKVPGKESSKSKHRSDYLVNRTKETYEKVDEKLQRVEEMLHHEVLREAKKSFQTGRSGKNDGKPFSKSHSLERTTLDLGPRKLTPSNSTIRQEMLTAMTGLNSNPNLGMRASGFPEQKKNHATAAVIANALLAARNSNIFNY